MVKLPISLTPSQVRVLARCSLHYHFLQQSRPPAPDLVDSQVRAAIQRLHAAGGPERMSLAACLQPVQHHDAAHGMVERYYHRLQRDWPRLIAGNEAMRLKISIEGVPMLLQATIDRLDKTSDGGILAILFRTEPETPPTEAELRQDHAITIYHALVAAAYPLKRPVRVQEWWLAANHTVTVELSEEEYRRNLSDLRRPARSLARGEVMARPGHYCETCPFQYQGCPVYSTQSDTENQSDDFVSPPSRGKIPPRNWIFKI